jgi:hypothetical protein
MGMARLTLQTLVLWLIIGLDKYMKNIVLIIYTVFLGLFPAHIFAANFFFESNHGVYGVQDSITIDVLLDTSETVNTISGNINISEFQNLSIDIVDGNSSILFWIDKPKIENNRVVFSGITPGGIQGPSLFLFSLVISGQKANDTLKFSVENGTVLLHDGEGTKKIITSLPKNIYISSDENFSQAPHQPSDKEQPEDFTPIITQNENLFDGKNVLVFATQDKNSGINFYAVKEGIFGTYTEVSSPYLLKDQKRFKTIFIKAVDNAGNERVAILHPQEKIFDENFILIFSILITVVTIGVIIYRKKHR